VGLLEETQANPKGNLSKRVPWEVEMAPELAQAATMLRVQISEKFYEAFSDESSNMHEAAVTAYNLYAVALAERAAFPREVCPERICIYNLRA
jgi:hypothetical protein